MTECKWEYQEDEDCWNTECGGKFIMLEATPAENNMRFCPYCGGALVQDEQGIMK